MDDLKREFCQEPGDMGRQQDLKPPRPPEKVRATEAGTIKTEKLRQMYQHGSRGIDRRHTSGSAENTVHASEKLSKFGDRPAEDRGVRPGSVYAPL